MFSVTYKLLYGVLFFENKDKAGFELHMKQRSHWANINHE
jgi:hypothetical protein